MKRPPSAAAVRRVVRLLPLLVWTILPVSVESQVVAEPVLRGQAFLADTALSSGTVVLHRMTAAAQGEIDSTEVGPDGSFDFRLPSVPDQAAGDMYFASLRHDGVMYFGTLVERPVDLDSLYVINAYDTIVAPPEGLPVVLESRSIFFEPNGNEWAITDLFELRSDRERTVVPRPGGRVWAYPLPEDARDVSAVDGTPPEVLTQVGDSVVYRGAMRPGEQPLLVLRYFVDSLGVTIPTPGETGMIDVLVREPAPSIGIEGLDQVESVQIESGSTYRRFAGEDVQVPVLRIDLVEETPPPPVEWIAVVLAVVLLGGGLLAIQRAPRAAAARPRGGGDARQAILVEIARLDEEYEREESPSSSRTREYQRRRAELMRRLKGAT